MSLSMYIYTSVSLSPARRVITPSTMTHQTLPNKSISLTAFHPLSSALELD